jgi:leader peptidase (prepilin peptidase) / N-methyltransferase
MTSAMILIGAGLVGALIGSFLNVCIHRLPRGESIVWPASHCPVCLKAIAWYDNVPLISYAWLRGKCRMCRAGISARYPVVEAVNAVGYVALFWHFGLTPPTFVYAALYSALIVMTGTDLSHRIIPDAVTLPGIVIGLLSGTFVLPIGLLNSLAGMLVGGGILWTLAWLSPILFGKEGMGGGDIKLMAMVGAVLGWKSVLLAIMVASLIGSIVGGGLIAAGVMRRQEYLPFGPFLAIGSVIALLFHEPLLNWYWSLFDVGQ